MASTITDTAILTKPVNVIFQQTLLRNAKPRAPYYEGSVAAEVVQHRGSFTASWRRIENLTPTTTALSELATTVSLPTRDSVTPTVTEVTQAVSKYGQYIVMNEEADLVNFDGQTDKLVEVLGISAGRSLNMLQRNEVEDNATLIYAGGAASDGAVVSGMTASVIKNAVNNLDRQSSIPFTGMTTGSQNIGTAPILPSYLAVCHSDVAVDAVGLTGFKSVEQYAGQVRTFNGEFGYYPVAGYGVRFISTPDASVDAGAGGATGSTGLRGSTNIDLYSTPIFGMEAVGSLGFGMEHIQEVYEAGDQLPAVMLINHGFGSSGVGDPFDELATMAWKSWHGAKILNSNWIRTIRSGASSLS